MQWGPETLLGSLAFQTRSNVDKAASDNISTISISFHYLGLSMLWSCKILSHLKRCISPIYLLRSGNIGFPSRIFIASYNFGQRRSILVWPYCDCFWPFISVLRKNGEKANLKSYYVWIYTLLLTLLNIEVKPTIELCR